MKLRILISIVTMCMLTYSCIKRDSSQVNKKVLQISDTYTHDTITCEGSPFNVKMKESVNEFISYIKDIDLKYSEFRTVYGIYFYSDKNGRKYIDMYTQPYYLKDLIQGYTYIEGNLIVYYGDIKIGDNYIDIKKLTPYDGDLHGFLESDSIPSGKYEPFGIRYQIISSDSLLIIAKGML